MNTTLSKEKQITIIDESRQEPSSDIIFHLLENGIISVRIEKQIGFMSVENLEEVLTYLKE